MNLTLVSMIVMITTVVSVSPARAQAPFVPRPPLPAPRLPDLKPPLRFPQPLRPTLVLPKIPVSPRMARPLLGSCPLLSCSGELSRHGIPWLKVVGVSTGVVLSGVGIAELRRVGRSKARAVALIGSGAALAYASFHLGRY